MHTGPSRSSQTTEIICESAKLLRRVGARARRSRTGRGREDPRRKTMGIVETVKGTIKATTHLVSGKTANLTLERKGKLAAGEIMEALVTVAPAGVPFEARGLFIELCVEEDLEETLVEKLRELVLRKGEPGYVIQVLGPFAVPATEKKIVLARFVVPGDLDMTHKWFMRARAQAFGVDASSPFVPMV
jgi:hypothetical protein